MSAALKAGAPDLRAIDTWLFDLDDTLYPPERLFIKQVERRIGEYVARVTGLPFDEAWALQRRWLEAHGTAIVGLVREHGVDPHDFMADVHEVPLDVLEPDPALRGAIARLPGRRLVFTNGSARHAERVLGRLDLADLFEDVFHAEAAEFVPKPHPHAFARLITRHGIAPTRTCFVEDRLVNLAPAAALGMTTVLVGPHALACDAGFVHHRAADLAVFLNGARVAGDA